jgi:O-antigen/teichoic acid export membrane protein
LALPLATHLLGAEAMGLVGFFATLLMVLMVAEGGLTSNIIHRMARSMVISREKAARNQAGDMSMTSTYFAVFVAVGVLVFLMLGLSSGLIVEHWLNAESLGNETVRRSIWFMAAFIGLNFPVMLLQAVLVGKERQMALNALFIPYSILRTVGVLLPLYLMPHLRSVDAYFFLQAVVQIMYFLILVWMAYRCTGFLPWLHRWKFAYLRRGYKYGSGVLLISITSILTTQYDKAYLSGHISLESFGYYSLASTLAGVAYIFSTAFNSVLFPRMAAYFAARDEQRVERIHTASLCIVASLLSLLCCAVLLFKDLLLGVLFAPTVAAGVSSVVAILMVGTSLQALLIVPFALQLATKWTTLAFRLNLAAIPVILVALPLMVGQLGAKGAAWVWLLYNVYSLALTFFFVCRRHDYLVKGVFACAKVVALTVVAGSGFFSVVRFVAEMATDEYYRLAAVMLAVLVAALVILVLNRKSLLAFR